MKVLIVGVGNMGKTYARSLTASHFAKGADLFLLDKNPVEESFVKGIPAGNVFSNATKKVNEADIIILAVKPQDIHELAPGLKPFVHTEQIILSIMAGIKMETVANLLGTKKIVRAMPNLPAQIGMGMTVFTCLPALDKKELFIIQNLLNTTGKSVYVEDENLVDAATALSGSGPAYVYYFMEAMIQAGMKMGFSQSEAELMVNQTFMGAVNLHNRNELTCGEWIKKVASKGGTTEAALKVFAANDLQTKIGDGISSAYQRAVELGKG
ncbi:MAG TPA: pyrroline-5-carboxylate reductase [Chitinophagales bacterium]|nr:pyrroline-5-carboxylate reductase [Chitinophagales bacterium]